MRHIICFVAFIAFFSGCRKKEEPQKVECSYEHFYSVSSIDESKNGNQLSANFRAVLDVNIPKLKFIKGRVDGRIVDTLYSDLRTSLTEKKVNYSSAFMERHNAIIDIICDIEKEINNPLTDSARRKRLQEEKSQKRDDYFNFLLELSNLKSDTIFIEKKIETTKNMEKRKSEFMEEFSFQLSSSTGGFKQLFVNGQSVVPLATSTKLNPRIKILVNPTKQSVLLLITQTEDTCEYVLPHKSTIRISLDCE